MKNLLTLFLFASCIVMLSACQACDCVGHSSFQLNFFDKQTGDPLSIASSNSTSNDKVRIDLICEPENSYIRRFSSNILSLDLDSRNSNLCHDLELQFNVIYQEEIVETVTTNFVDTGESRCGCQEGCMGVMNIRLDSADVDLVGGVDVDIAFNTYLEISL